MRILVPSILEFRQVCFREFLPQWIYQLECPHSRWRSLTALVIEICSTCPLVKPMRLPLSASYRWRPKPTRKLLELHVKGMVGRKVCCVHLVLAICILGNQWHEYFYLFRIIQ